jgi:hypothetical protein
VARATSADDAAALATLPKTLTNPVDNSVFFTVRSALARVLGLDDWEPSSDSTISLKTSDMNLSTLTDGWDVERFSLFAVVSHEINEAIGFGSSIGRPFPPSPQDLFRYSSPGVRSYTTNNPPFPFPTAFFLLDGTNALAAFNQAPSGDYGDWYSPGGQTPQVQDAFGTRGASPELGVELRGLDVIGYTRGPGSVWLDFAQPLIPSVPTAGAFHYPDNIITTAVARVPVGGTILIKSSVGHATPRITKPCRLVAVNGPVRIGP